MAEEDRDMLARKCLLEPITALLNTPVAWVGPLAWTAGWFVIPLFVNWLIRMHKRSTA
jgi:hypothetical protein